MTDHNPIIILSEASKVVELQQTLQHQTRSTTGEQQQQHSHENTFYPSIQQPICHTTDGTLQSSPCLIPLLSSKATTSINNVSTPGQSIQVASGNPSRYHRHSHMGIPRNTSKGAVLVVASTASAVTAKNTLNSSYSSLRSNITTVKSLPSSLSIEQTKGPPSAKETIKPVTKRKQEKSDKQQQKQMLPAEHDKTINSNHTPFFTSTPVMPSVKSGNIPQSFPIVPTASMLYLSSQPSTVPSSSSQQQLPSPSKLIQPIPFVPLFSMPIPSPPSFAPASSVKTTASLKRKQSPTSGQESSAKRKAGTNSHVTTLREGYPEEFPSRTDNSQSSSDSSAEEKKRRRQERNREAAQASRERKKKYISDLEEKVSALQKRVSALEQENRMLKTHLQLSSDTHSAPPTSGSNELTVNRNEGTSPTDLQPLPQSDDKMIAIMDQTIMKHSSASVSLCHNT